MVKDDGIKLVDKTINLLETISIWDEKMAMQAHKIGLQGEKRKERYTGRKAHLIAQKLQHDVYDIFDAELYPVAQKVPIPNFNSAKDYYIEYINKMWYLYEELHMIANTMVTSNLKPLSGCIYKLTDCMFNDILHSQRFFKECEKAKWEYHHISRYQVSLENIHDEYEKKEESQ